MPRTHCTLCVNETPPHRQVRLGRQTGDTALTLACRFGHRRVVELLLSKGCDINVQNKVSVRCNVCRCTSGLVDPLTAACFGRTADGNVCGDVGVQGAARGGGGGANEEVRRDQPRGGGEGPPPRGGALRWSERAHMWVRAPTVWCMAGPLHGVDVGGRVPGSTGSPGVASKPDHRRGFDITDGTHAARILAAYLGFALPSHALRHRRNALR